MKVIFRGGA